jgi:hypothetical protein
MKRFTAGILLLTVVTAVEAQSIDEGTFSIRQGGREIGREDFAIQSGRQGAPTGSTLTSRIRLPAVRPSFTQESVIERRQDGSFANMVIHYRAGGVDGRVLAEIARNVLRIHNASGGTEGIREFPAAENLIGLADSSFALYTAVADLATPEGRRIAGVYPRSGRRVSFTARREGDPQEGTRIVMAGEIAGTIWLDGSGHLMRIEFPGSGMEIVRIRK